MVRYLRLDTNKPDEQPPTLIPLKASREAAILKQIDSGMGTHKTTIIEEGLNLNNFMKETVFGVVDNVAAMTNPDGPCLRSTR